MISYEVSVTHGVRLAAGAPIVVMLVVLFALAAAAAPPAAVVPRAGGGAVSGLLEAVMVGGLCGVVGVHVLLRRLPFFTMALGHATFPRVVLAALLGVNLFLGAALFGTVVVLVVAVLGAPKRIDETSAIGVILSGAFTLVALLLSAQAGFSRDLAAYLAGSIVTVQPGDLVTTALAGAAVLAVLAALHKELVFAAFDRGGLPPSATRCSPLDVAMLLVEVTLVTSTPAVAPSWRSPCWWRRRPPPPCGPSAWARLWRWPPASASPTASPAWSCLSIGGSPPARPSPWSPPACSPSRCWPPPPRPARPRPPPPPPGRRRRSRGGVSGGGVRAGR